MFHLSGLYWDLLLWRLPAKQLFRRTQGLVQARQVCSVPPTCFLTLKSDCNSFCLSSLEFKLKILQGQGCLFPKTETVLLTTEPSLQLPSCTCVHLSTTHTHKIHYKVNTGQTWCPFTFFSITSIYLMFSFLGVTLYPYVCLSTNGHAYILGQYPHRIENMQGFFSFWDYITLLYYYTFCVHPFSFF